MSKAKVLICEWTRGYDVKQPSGEAAALKATEWAHWPWACRRAGCSSRWWTWWWAAIGHSAPSGAAEDFSVGWPQWLPAQPASRPSPVWSRLGPTDSAGLWIIRHLTVLRNYLTNCRYLLLNSYQNHTSTNLLYKLYRQLSLSAGIWEHREETAARVPEPRWSTLGRRGASSTAPRHQGSHWEDN